jgi:hypothetical protein
LALGTSCLPQLHGIQLDLGSKVDVEKQISVISLIAFQTSRLPRYEITPTVGIISRYEIMPTETMNTFTFPKISKGTQYVRILFRK